MVKIRSPEEAEKDFALLKAAMAEADSCLWGLWTNGLDFFYFEKETTRFDVKFRSMGDWPLADETIGTRLLASGARLRKAEPEMLKAAFRRCHNFIPGDRRRQPARGSRPVLHAPWRGEADGADAGPQAE
ncbi:hypothetical protein CKO31_01500 [Thiohalocapsa halophila]|uniref:Type I restriction enzyme R protein N-terminal domain-containing protein n=1 Tax=Thiohalocapsa halophila TaxID=69359 RepID=A0ABS1CBZ6_9GAMM|nr:hypothetical protein [Thiohalocapsa halophila]MBK1629431.1 hypothetical protein [Thiohalocapsa halophila]